MAYNLGHSVNEAAAQDSKQGKANSVFQVSSEPVVPAGDGPAEHDSRKKDADLPTSYGTPILCLIPRDPQSLFAYWDIDWNEAFRDRAPADRKVYLRLLNTDRLEQATIEIEPMAGSCFIEVAGSASYSGEIGYQQASAGWIALARSAAIATPRDLSGEMEGGEFATVPFHLSFQRMVDILRVGRHEQESLVAMLSELRGRATAPEEERTLTAGEREIIQAIAQASRSATGSVMSRDLWTQTGLEGILGFGAHPTSPTHGFAPGGSGGGS